MKAFLVMIAFVLLYFFRLPGLLPEEYRRDLVVFTFFMIIAFSISILAVIGVKLPYPSTEIMKIFKAVFH